MVWSHTTCPDGTNSDSYTAWTAGARQFRCVIRTPRGIRVGKSHRYVITVTENLGTGFLMAPAMGHAVNPEVIHFGSA